MQMDGANLFDPKDSREARPPNPSDKEAYTEDIRSECGLITHADLAAICKMILNFEAEMAGVMGSSFLLKDVILFKADLSEDKGAPGTVRHLARLRKVAR
jgi:hypothetical protein